ncbi:MAG: hypothetical protein ACYC0Y_23565 [Pirellulales bacterium]
MRLMSIGLAACLAVCGSMAAAQPPIRPRPPAVPQDLPVVELLNLKIQLAARAADLRAAEGTPYAEPAEIVRLATEIENLRALMVVILGEYPDISPLLGSPELGPSATDGGPAWDSGWNRFPTVIDLAAIRGLQARLSLVVRDLVIAQTASTKDAAKIEGLAREIRGIVAEIYNFGGAYPALGL